MRLKPVYDRASRKDLVKELQQTRQQGTLYLKALAALLIDANGRICIPFSTLALLDDAMVVRHATDESGVVFTLLVPSDAQADEAQTPEAEQVAIG